MEIMTKKTLVCFYAPTVYMTGMGGVITYMYFGTKCMIIFKIDTF